MRIIIIIIQVTSSPYLVSQKSQRRRFVWKEPPDSIAPPLGWSHFCLTGKFLSLFTFRWIYVHRISVQMLWQWFSHNCKIKQFIDNVFIITSWRWRCYITSERRLAIYTQGNCKFLKYIFLKRNSLPRQICATVYNWKRYFIKSKEQELNWTCSAEYHK